MFHYNGMFHYPDVRQSLFGKFCSVKNKETHCGRNYQHIFKVALNLTKNHQIILGRRWLTTCRCQMKVITRQAAFTFSWLLCGGNKPPIILSVSFHYPFSVLSLSFQCPFIILSVSFHFLSLVFPHFFRINSQHRKHHEPEHHVIMKAW